MADKKKSVQGFENVLADKPAVLGTFEGKCGDAMVTNENGLDITREVWETVFASEDYKQGIKLGWFIGYLGHPEDPGCQDFKNGCIIMRDGWIDDNGEIYGKFDLIDTPVGRIVKAFIDAGVTFGISVRGCGEIYSNSVDPETFIFRGFDLVAFPAYRDAIPEFSQIAASSNLEDQKRWKKICASVSENLKGITSCESLEILKDTLPDNSDICKDVRDRLAEVTVVEVPEEDIASQRFNGLLTLYLDALKQIKCLKDELASKNDMLCSTQASMSIEAGRKLRAVKRIYADQVSALTAQNDELENKYKNVIQANKQLRAEASRLNATMSSVTADTHVTDTLQAENKELRSKVKKLEAQNLNLKQKVTSSKNSEELESVLASIRSKLSETVSQRGELERSLSNRDREVKELKSDVECTLETVADYQDAYANLYASVTGRDLSNIEVSPQTTVKELKQMIDGGTNTANIAPAPALTEPEEVDVVSYDDMITV